ncbi:MAG TPA: SRPBCC domain-containing protein [Candidatus Dormibacteraeota bacterium]|nr:SRPBCC domain-containing protein [Candidatus Dormibacteraeota bacterium]
MKQSIEVTRRLAAPIDEVFRWWTESELVGKWMAPIGDVRASLDARVGGSLKVVMSGQGVVIEHTGEFLEIDRPRRLAFTWKSRFTGDQPSIVTVELEPDGDDATLVRIVHAELPESAVVSHRDGWGGMLARLERELGMEVRKSHAS